MKNKLLDIKKDEQKILREVNERIKKNKRIERACRDLCLHNGVNPDILVCKQMPAYVNYPIPTFILPDPQYTMFAWQLYQEVVIQALNILEATND